ncbi:uncharacterized protein CC84DRAFT_155588 [Paraphaeosphaeria sporulosa]|uniref:Uncharacterized protein n=1 Tax=Paraphaeosphaeria sporulosa TaxID=1460663 RepID=A0A177CZX9_9PLEO|nr:uncharacterized protein CC84DRAFT_155588 [Paraphaeosphaeria sporulosa]OAG12691.1 hypothetical protein CC84DRAFT_155588 [Paraphaeosphaeria sporulosa]
MQQHFPNFRLALSNPTRLVHTYTRALQPALAPASILCVARLFCPLHASYPKLYALRPVVTTIPDTHSGVKPHLPPPCIYSSSASRYFLVSRSTTFPAFVSLCCCIAALLCSVCAIFLLVYSCVSCGVYRWDTESFSLLSVSNPHQHHASAWCRVMNLLKPQLVLCVNLIAV